MTTTTTALGALGRTAYRGAGHYEQPQLLAAGGKSNVQESAKECMTWMERPATPPHQRKYRQLLLHEPGAIVRHPGAADDPIPEGPFGDKTLSKPGDNVAEYIRGTYPTSEMGRWQLQQAEDVYASSKQEPLGRGLQRGFHIPSEMGTTRAFGASLGAQELDRKNQLKHIVFPTDKPMGGEEEGSQAHANYVRSHQAYLPGEQRRRDYEWAKAGVDPTTHSFGYKDKGAVHEGVRMAIQPELNQLMETRAVVGSKVQEDHRLATTHRLGGVQTLGRGERGIPADHAFGMPSLRPGLKEPSVDELMKFSLSEEQQQPDGDLGKSLREGWRNIAPEGRTFGTPTVRLDRPLPKTRSCASNTNYGNEPDALQLLRPPRSVERGVNETHYIQLRSREEIEGIVEEAGIQLTPEQFEAVFGMSCEADGEEGRCCLDTWFRARHHVLSKMS